MLVSVAILGVVVSTAAYQMLASERLRKTQFDRAAAVGLADSAMLQTLLAFRDETRRAAERNPLGVRAEMLKSMLELIKHPPTGEVGGKIVTLLTKIPAPANPVRDADQYVETTKRCQGRRPARPASPHFSDSALYFCVALTQVDATKSSLWQGTDPDFPVLIEAQILPVEASSGKALRFDDVVRERSAAMLRVLYSVVWVADKGAAKSQGSAQSVRWLAREQHAPVF